MKVILVCFVTALCMVSVIGDRCYSQDDCEDDQCCTGGITPWIKGTCRNFADEGEACDPSTPSTGKYFLNCPCKAGLTCDDSVKIVGSIRCIRK